MTNFRSIAAGAACLALASCAGQPDYRAETAPPETVASVDLERYQGLWYEIARYPNRFEEGCEGVTAEYALNDDGTVRVLNTCRQGAVDGPRRTAEGRARVVEDSRGSRLKVQFAPSWVPFAEGDYWVLALDDAYQSALVGDPDGRYLWILARTPKLSDERLDELRAIAADKGYDPNALRMVDQPPAP